MGRIPKHQTRAVVVGLLFYIALLYVPDLRAADEDKSFTSYLSFQGSSNTNGQVTKLEPSLGYKFNKYFAIGGGLPFYFVRAADPSATTGVGSRNGIGNAYIDLRLTLKNPVVKFFSVLTGTAPTGDRDTGFSTGRVTVDWTNHLDGRFGAVTPFVNLGLANTISDTHFFSRPFTTLGTNTHFEGGADFDVSPLVTVGASAYSVVPTGEQKVFSRLVRRAQTAGIAPVPTNPRGRGQLRRVYETAGEIVGDPDLTRDYGYSVWFDVFPSSYVNFEVGYSRSAYYELDTVFFSVGINLGRLARRAAKP